MRRKELEITDINKMEEIIKDCHCVRIGFCDEGEVYIVPLNFGYELNDGSFTFYFHSAKEGRKVDIMRKNDAVGFELDTGYKLTVSHNACSHSPDFQSIIGNGKMIIIEENDEKIKALSLIMEHNTGKKDWDFPQKAIDSTLIYKLVVTKISCKQKK